MGRRPLECLGASAPPRSRRGAINDYQVAAGPCAPISTSSLDRCPRERPAARGARARLAPPHPACAEAAGPSVWAPPEPPRPAAGTMTWDLFRNRPSQKLGSTAS